MRKEHDECRTVEQQRSQERRRGRVTAALFTTHQAETGLPAANLPHLTGSGKKSCQTFVLRRQSRPGGHAAIATILSDACVVWTAVS